ncbi:MAG: D-aminoacyl-tRNA deacylase [Patescibacteria group bacterium]
MRVVLQKVKRAFVEVNEKLIAEIADGFVIFLAIKKGDLEKDADNLIEKILKIKLFSDYDSETFMQYNLSEFGGACLIISQFTLYGKVEKGSKTDFGEAADKETAEKLYNYFVLKMKEKHDNVQIGEFGEHMEVELKNDGPITLILDS